MCIVPAIQGLGNTLIPLASGIADISSLMSHGINVAIGTDGAASNNALDMFREMYLCTVLQKLRYSRLSRSTTSTRVKCSLLPMTSTISISTSSRFRLSAVPKISVKHSAVSTRELP